ncbi:MAG: amidohydrolase family protein [Immundisolibacterales bacterium]|nr:amidohydrolase family protein [Immundisolibacterales bacterium]
MLDTVLRGARIAGADADAPLVDIAIAGGTIAAVEPSIRSDADCVELGGKLVSPGLVETHIHLDKSRIVDRCAPAAGRARDHMERVSAVKPGFTVEDVYARAAATLEQCILNGTTHVRTHVEVDPNVGLRSFEALEQLATDYAWAVDLELCVFAQEGWTNVPETDRNVVAALDRGASVVGGAPGYDPDRAGQIRRIFELAREYDRDVDIHLDVGPSADEMDIGLVCELTERHGYGGRVAVGHGTKYSLLPPDRLRALGERLASAGVAVTVLPATDLFVTGRHQDHAVVRGVADANALVAHGANCSLSTNNVLNPFTPYGDCSLIRIANLYANVVQRGNEDELAECFEMLTRRSARLIRCEDYGIAVGRPADLVVWNARSAADAVATIALPLTGFKRGRRTFSRARPELHRP